jgi:hypothetical protein
VLFYIVYTDSEVVLTKVEYESWRELQNDFCDYKASLGPWAEGQIVEFLGDEYPKIEPSAFEQVSRLKECGHNEIVLSFSE